MKKIFISYRRADAEYAAGALGRELRSCFGEEQVFRDKEDIGAGVSWKQHVVQEIDHDSALLVLIAKDWANARDAKGERRLDNPEDSIRLEIRDGIQDRATVIPILLENAQMPAEADLPPDIKPMADLNAVPLRDSDWRYDVDRICKALAKAGFKPVTFSSPMPLPQPGEGQAVPGGKSRGTSSTMIASYIVGVLTMFGFEETNDSDTQWGLALFGLVALVLAVLAYRDYRLGKSNNKWGAIGAIVMGAVLTLAYAAWALDPTPNSNTGSTAAGKKKPSPAVRSPKNAAPPAKLADKPRHPAVPPSKASP